MKRLKIGDLIEIQTNIGIFYALYTHKHRMYGALIRIFDKIYERRPENLQGVISEKVRFSTFFPLKAALSKGIFVAVGNYVVSPELQKFPIFRSGTPDQKTKKVKNWWFWDGENEWKVGELNQEQKKIPIRGVWNDTLLIKRIESGWLPENDITT